VGILFSATLPDTFHKPVENLDERPAGGSELDLNPGSSLPSGLSLNIPIVAFAEPWTGRPTYKTSSRCSTSTKPSSLAPRPNWGGTLPSKTRSMVIVPLSAPGADNRLDGAALRGSLDRAFRAEWFLRRIGQVHLIATAAQSAGRGG
jgi:hypothetical protein